MNEIQWTKYKHFLTKNDWIKLSAKWSPSWLQCVINTVTLFATVSHYSGPSHLRDLIPLLTRPKHIVTVLIWSKCSGGTNVLKYFLFVECNQQLWNAIVCIGKILYYFIILTIVCLHNIYGCKFSVCPFPLWWLREYILCLSILIKSEVWINIHCLGLGHETMVCAVCLSIFLCWYMRMNIWSYILYIYWWH